MAEMIPVVSATGEQSWSGSVPAAGHTEALKFRVVGGTFADATTEKDITPSSGSDYAVSLKATVTVAASATQSVLLYYQDGDMWVLVHPLSRIFVRPQTKELDYRLVTQGMDAMPLGTALNSTYGGLVLGGGVRIPTVQDMQQTSVAKFSDFDNTFFDLTKPVSVVYDRQGRTLYYIHTDGDASNTKVFGGMSDVDIAGYKVSYDTNNKRSAVVFHTSGQIDVLDNAMNPNDEPVQLGYEVNRVICRRAGVGTNTVDSYVAFDKDGRAHYLNASFVETSVKSDQFYVNGSDSYDVLSTLEGKLVGGNTAAAPASVFWYQFVPSSLLVMGHDGTNVYQFNLRDNVQNVAARPLVANDLVVYNTTAAWSDKGGKFTAGMDTNGSNALFNFASAETPTQTRSNWPYIELVTPPYVQSDTYDRLFYYVARPTTGLKHLALRNYTTVWPDLSKVNLGPSVTFNMTVNAGDPDIPFTVDVPAGVTVAVQHKIVTIDPLGVEHTTYVPVTKVYDDWDIVVTLSHPYITSSSFPISIGHTVYQFEMKADDTPNAFSWQNILGIDNDTWNRTEDVVISGINVSVPVSVLVDGVEDYDRMKIFVDGTETAMPVFIRNNQKLGFEILHENDTSRIDVDVGQGTSHFSLFTIVEAQLDVGRHWAYVPIGKQVQSDVLKNTGTIPLVLTITDTDAVFANGLQTITLAVNATTSIKFTPTENKQYAVKFHSDQYAYEWYVWADSVWLGTLPQTKRAERYVMGDSGTFFIDNIPDNFWTYFTIPAGMLLDIDGVRVTQELDSRGVYKEQGLVVGPFECAETMLKIYGLPSHNQPHTLQFGNAKAGWLYDMTTDPTYTAYGTDSVQMFDVSYLDATDKAVSVVDAKTYVATFDKTVLLTPAYDPELDDQLTWFEFADKPAFVYDSFARNADTGQRDAVQIIKGNDFDTGHKHFVDNFPLFDLVAESNVASDNFPLFKMEDVPALASDSFSLPKFIGTNEGYATDAFPLFELTQGQQHTASDFPLFESIVGENIVSDWFWPDFASGLALVSDTFINNFVEHMDDAPQYFDLRSPEYHTVIKAKSDQILPKFMDTKGNYVADVLEPRHAGDGGLFPMDSAEPRHVSGGGLFPQEMYGPQYVEPSAVYHIGWARPMWRPVSVTYKVGTMTAKYVDPDYHPAVLFMPEIPFTRWLKPSQIYHYDPAEPLRMEHVVKYPVAPAAGEFEQLRLIAAPVVPHSPIGIKKPPVYLHLIQGKLISAAPQINTDVLEPDLIKAPRIIPVSRAPGTSATRAPISVEVRTSRKADSNKTYAVLAPVVEAWTVAPNHGSIDKPLEEGYFETELLALQNATQVWGFDPSVVYAIQQPSGYWTWAQITVCEESCGSMSCAARGYLSGG